MIDWRIDIAVIGERIAPASDQARCRPLGTGRIVFFWLVHALRAPNRAIVCAQRALAATLGKTLFMRYNGATAHQRQPLTGLRDRSEMQPMSRVGSGGSRAWEIADADAFGTGLHLDRYFDEGDRV